MTTPEVFLKLKHKSHCFWFVKLQIEIDLKTIWFVIFLVFNIPFLCTVFVHSIYFFHCEFW